MLPITSKDTAIGGTPVLGWAVVSSKEPPYHDSTKSVIGQFVLPRVIRV
jgi:hypothetical protein